MHVNPDIARLLNGLNNPSLPGIDLSLERMWQLLTALGNPQEKLPPVIHIAGTNGKGSTLAFLRAIYEAAGYKVHVYTSPHLVRFNERIVLAGAEISDAALLPLLERVTAAAKDIPVTFFEATTAAALLAFVETKADIVLLETGLGGRLDATNVVAKPMATVITPIDYDHIEFLGDTLTEIAREKAGIMKLGVPCIVGAQKPEAMQALARAAYAVRAPLLVCGLGWNAAVTNTEMQLIMDTVQLALPLPALQGAHQAHNAALAAAVVKSVEMLPVPDTAIAEGIRKARWPGRVQVLEHGPLVEVWGARGQVVLDGAHNVSAAEVLVHWIVAQTRPVTLICGMMARKDAVAFFAPFAGRIRKLITVPIPGEQSYTAQALAEAAKAAGVTDIEACETVDAALGALVPEANGTLLITGSLFLAGEILKNHG